MVYIVLCNVYFVVFIFVEIYNFKSHWFITIFLNKFCIYIYKDFLRELD